MFGREQNTWLKSYHKWQRDLQKLTPCAHRIFFSPCIPTCQCFFTVKSIYTTALCKEKTTTTKPSCFATVLAKLKSSVLAWTQQLAMLYSSWERDIQPRALTLFFLTCTSTVYSERSRKHFVIKLFCPPGPISRTALLSQSFNCSSTGIPLKTASVEFTSQILHITTSLPSSA